MEKMCGPPLPLLFCRQNTDCVGFAFLQLNKHRLGNEAPIRPLCIAIHLHPYWYTLLWLFFISLYICFGLQILPCKSLLILDLAFMSYFYYFLMYNSPIFSSRPLSPCSPFFSYLTVFSTVGLSLVVLVLVWQLSWYRMTWLEDFRPQRKSSSLPSDLSPLPHHSSLSSIRSDAYSQTNIFISSCWG